MESKPPTDDELSRELRSLADRVAVLEQWITWWASQPTPPPMPPAAASPTQATAQAPEPTTRAPEPTTPARQAPARRRLRPDGVSLEDLVGGRLLSWAGAIAVLIGVAFFVAVAIGRGWIDERTRILLSFAGCLLLAGAGAWLHERRGRTQASTAMVGTATAGMFLTLTAASQLYHLMAVGVGLAGALAIGALTTALAVRWNSATIAAIGILGALLGPVLIGAGPSGSTIGYEAVALTAGVAVLVWRGWGWLSVAAFAVTAPQLLSWALDAESAVAIVLVSALFWVLYAVAGIGYDLRGGRKGLQPASALVIGAAALVVGAAGLFGLRDAGHSAGGDWFVAGLAAAHLVAALALIRRRRELGMLLAAGALTLGDIAFGLIVSGPALAIGWALSAVGIGLLARRADLEDRLAPLALGAQLSLATVHVLLFDAPPGAIAGSARELGSGLAALLSLAAGAFVCARLVSRRADVSNALDVAAMGALAYATAVALEGPAVAAAWAAQAAVLGGVHRRFADRLAGVGAVAFLALAVLHVLFLDAPADGLFEGAGDLRAAWISLAAIVAAALVLRRQWPATGDADDATRWRVAMELVAAIALVYLASQAIVTTFPPPPAGTGEGLTPAQLGQQGQTLLSGFWALTGLGGLVYGLVADQRHWRLAGLTLLSLAIAKVFIYDLSALESLYRVLSFIALGLLLLAGAYAYQRLRPEEPPASS